MLGYIDATARGSVGNWGYKMRAIVTALLIAGAPVAIGSASAAQATTYTENFEGTFPAWESGWFGQNSNATNCYSTGRGSASRGNNPDGLWVSTIGQGCNGAAVTVRFNADFASTLTDFALDVAGYTSTTLSFYDAAGALLSANPVTLTYGATTDPGSYARYAVTSSTGIGSFTFSGFAAGNTSIDNLVATTNVGSAVPEPATWGMMLAGFGAVGVALRRRRSVRVAYAA